MHFSGMSDDLKEYCWKFDEFHMRLSFGLKIGLSISLLAVGVTAGSLAFFYANTKLVLFEQMGNRLEDIGRTALRYFGENERKAIRKLKAEIEAKALPTDMVIEKVEPGNYKRSLVPEVADGIMKTAEFQQLVSILRSIKSPQVRPASAPPAEGQVEHKPSIAYATLITTVPNYAADPRVLRFLADADYDDPEAPNPVGNLFKNNSDALQNAFRGEVLSDESFREEDMQTLFSAGIPIIEPDGTVLAILALDYDANSEANQVHHLFLLCIAIVGVSFLLSVVVACILARILNRPIRSLRQGADRVKARDFTTHIDLDSNDELGLLAGAFNSMVTEIREYSEGLEVVNQSYARFVPREFLDQLGETNIIDVKLGDQVQRRMTVLFADIRSFTTISESMSPRDNFDFINHYLGQVSPVIRDNHGFIDKFIGDAVMALFPENPEDAVKASIAMHKSLVEFNQKGKDLGRPAVKIGVGLHNGNLMLGTVGEERRLEGTVISDAVNLASRLEGVTKEYGAPVIVSDKVMDGLNHPEIFHTRYLGKVQVKGKSAAIKIYEIIDAEEEDAARRKIITKNDFERGVKAYEKGDLERSVKYFKRVLKIHKTDIACHLYMDRCAKLEAKGQKIVESVRNGNGIMTEEKAGKQQTEIISLSKL